MHAWANVVVWVLGLYVSAGVLFAVPFVIIGAGRLDPLAQAGSWGFRLFIAPGVVALWPLLLRRWISGSPPEERNAHRIAAREARR